MLFYILRSHISRVQNRSRESVKNALRKRRSLNENNKDNGLCFYLNPFAFSTVCQFEGVPRGTTGLDRIRPDVN